MFITLHLNSRLQPVHRFELEDVMMAVFEENDIDGEVTGGGTETLPNGEIKGCDIELEFSDKPEDLDRLLGLLDRIGISKGSALKCGETDYPVGTLEGAALYLNGCDLPAEVYQNSDVNELIAQLDDALGDSGALYSWQELDKFTVLYYYGASFDDMTAKMADVISTHPLCQKSRVEQIS